MCISPTWSLGSQGSLGSLGSAGLSVLTGPLRAHWAYRADWAHRALKALTGLNELTGLMAHMAQWALMVLRTLGQWAHRAPVVSHPVHKHISGID